MSNQPRPAPCQGLRQRARRRGGARRDDGRPRVGARRPAGRGRPRAADEAHADAGLRLRRHRRARRRGSSGCSTDMEDAGDERSGRDRVVLEEIRDGERFMLVTHENPDGDALGSLVGMHNVLARAGQGQRDVHVRRRVPAALRVPLLRPRGARRRAAGRPRRAHGRSTWTAATSTATRREIVKRDDAHIVNIDHHHDNTRFGTVNLGGRRRVLHGRDRLGPDARRSASSRR